MINKLNLSKASFFSLSSISSFLGAGIGDNNDHLQRESKPMKHLFGLQGLNIFVWSF